jgi:hypothetical protein
MKLLRALGFALVLGFLAPFTQAAPTWAPEPTSATAPVQAAADNHATGPNPASAVPHDPARTAHPDPKQSAPRPWPDAGRDRDRNSPPPAADSTVYPDADQNAAPVFGEQDASPTDNPGTDPAPAHYTMDDLANAAPSLDATYDSSHFSMDDIGGL